MNIKDVMSPDIVIVYPETTLREAARRMSERNIGAAIVPDAMGGRAGIITERDVLNSVAADQDLDKQLVRDTSTTYVVTVSLDLSLEEAAERMLGSNFRHLLVVHGADVVGIISMRDLMRALISR